MWIQHSSSFTSSFFKENQFHDISNNKLNSQINVKHLVDYDEARYPNLITSPVIKKVELLFIGKALNSARFSLKYKSFLPTKKMPVLFRPSMLSDSYT